MANQRDVVTTVITNDMGCVVEVRKCADLVRCKDCKHSRIEGNTTKYRWCKGLNVAINDNDYCSYAERREP